MQGGLVESRPEGRTTFPNKPVRATKEEPTTQDAHNAGAGGSSWLGTLRSVIAAVENSDAHEVEVQTQGIHITLRRSLDHIPLSATRENVGADLEGIHTVRCPLTGVWYDSPAPGMPAFVQTGDFVGVGAVIGLLETMKVFNEVHADCAGTVRQIMARRGDLVMAHAPLITIEPSTPPDTDGLS